MSFAIGGKRIGPGEEPFIIAEMSANHNGSLDRALAIVDAAADAGASALKIQTYTPDTMTLDLREGEFLISDPQSLWKGKTLYELYREAMTPWDWHGPIFERCRKRGLAGFSTPFDATSADFLQKLNVPCYKIASFENTDLALIRKVASMGKPLFVSTGMATLEETEEIVRTARAAGCRDLVLLKCTSVYPADPSEANVLTVPDMQKRFGCPVGLSDHTPGIGAAIAAVAHGAVAVEKHFTLSRQDAGVDSAFSLEPAELGSLVTEAQRARASLGEVTYEPTRREKASLVFRRTLYVARDIRAGEAITHDNVRAIRPGLGLACRHYDSLMGRKAARDLKKGTALKWEHLQ